MPIRTQIWTVGAQPAPLKAAPLASEQLLEAMIVAAPALLSDNWMLIGRQENTGQGGRINLLAMAPDAALVLIELKRERTPREVVAQALEYAAWVECLNAGDIAAIYQRFRPEGDLAADFQTGFGLPLEAEALNQSHQILTKRLQRLLKLWLDQIHGLDIAIINGDTAAVAKKSEILTRKQLIDVFEAKAGFNVLIMSPVAAGVGLTVIGANHVVHLERHWNPAKEAQASDRAYRIGQKKDVHIHLPAVVHPEFDSFDVHLDRLLRGKLMLKDAVVMPESVSEAEIMKSMGL
ncbi:hypothetical protein GCM10027514_37170 [Azotobacter armeniacus]